MNLGMGSVPGASRVELINNVHTDFLSRLESGHLPGQEVELISSLLSSRLFNLHFKFKSGS